MIQASDFIQPAQEFGFKTWAGVPCSFLTPFINSIIDDPDMMWLLRPELRWPDIERSP